MLSTPVLREAHLPSTNESLGQTPGDLLKQLESLVGTLEDSFTSSEQVLAISPASPSAKVTLQAEKDRRQRLLRQLTQLVASSNSSTVSEDVLNAFGSSSIGTSIHMDSICPSENASAPEGEDTGSAEWKYTTLMRLRKFLRRQYRARKNKVVDSVSCSAGAFHEDISDERAQLQQLAADIKSIEYEIRLLSNSKSNLQQSASYSMNCSAGPKEGSVQGDSARSQRDTVKRLLKSAGSVGGGSASRRVGFSPDKRLAGLHEDDECDLAVVEDAADGLSGVRRNLLELYADPLQDIGGTGALSNSEINLGSASSAELHNRPSPSMGDDAISACAPDGNLQTVETCIVAIKNLGAKVRAAESSACSENAEDNVEAEDRENNTSPCKLVRLARQLETDMDQRENNSSPSKIARLERRAEVDQVQERETHSSPSKIDRKHSRMATKAPLPEPGDHAPTCCSWESFKPINLVESKGSSTAARDAWSDVDLARWAAVNRGTSCPSPVHVAPVVLPYRVVHGAPRSEAADANRQHVARPLKICNAGTRRLDSHVEGEEEAVEALAAEKFVALEDKDAVLNRAAIGTTATGAPVAVGWSIGSDVEEHSSGAGHSRGEGALSCGDVSTAEDETLLRTIKKILNGPGSTPVRESRVVCTEICSVEGLLAVKDLEELSLECLAALRSSAFLDNAGESVTGMDVENVLDDANSCFECLDDVCGQARLESRGDSDDLGREDISDVFLKSVDVSGSLAAAGCEDPGDDSMIEGTSLLEDYEALEVDRTAENVLLFPYVFTATPSGEPSIPVEKALVIEFDKVGLERDKVVAPIVLGNTPMGEPSGPVAKSLMQMFDQCLSPSTVQDGAPASSPGQAARAQTGSESLLRTVVKRLEFPSEPEPQVARLAVASAATLPEPSDSGSCAGVDATMAGTKLNVQRNPNAYMGTSRPMTAAVTRSKAATASRPMSAASGRMPTAAQIASNLGDGSTATRGKATSFPQSNALIAASAGGGVEGNPASKFCGPGLAWSAPKCDTQQAGYHNDVLTRSETFNNNAPAGSSASGGGGLFSAARAQAREAQRDSHPIQTYKDAPSVRLAPPLRSPLGTDASSPLALIGNSTGGLPSRTRSTSRPPSGTTSRAANGVATRAASASPQRQMFGSVGLVAAREAMSLQQARGATAATSGAVAACGWLPQQQRLSPPSYTQQPQNSSTASGATNGSGVARGVGASVGGTTYGVCGVRTQVTLNNKMDLMASVRLARRTQTSANSTSAQSTVVSAGARRVPHQETVVLPKTCTTASAGANEIKPINCLPISKVAPVSADSCAAGTQGLLVGGSTMTLGQTAQVGGKRITAPRVTGGGVASKQPSRLPPRAAALSLEDVDLSSAQGGGSDNISPADREGELPSLPAADRTSAVAAGGLSSELMQLLREAAAERLANYRVQ